jgi:hypothetical protein
MSSDDELTLEQQELEDFAKDDPIFQPDAENYEYERSE